MQVAASTGAPVRNCEFDLVYEDGTSRNLLGNAVPILDENGRPSGSVGAFVDVTELKHTEERLRQVQKLESVGLLAGGIAHDFNNILTGILGNASMIVDTGDPDTADRISQVISGAERAANLTRQLLAYSGKGQFMLKDLDLSQAVNAMGDLMQFSIPKSAHLALNLERRLPAVRMDPCQLEQVVLNLVINAGEAIGEGVPGRITVSTSVVEVAEPFLDTVGQEIAAGRYVAIEVTDTGSGIDQEKQSRIFDPFFTKFKASTAHSARLSVRWLGRPVVLLSALMAGFDAVGVCVNATDMLLLSRRSRQTAGQPTCRYDVRLVGLIHVLKG